MYAGAATRAPAADAARNIVSTAAARIRIEFFL
jgi:hypothetical protein